MPAEGPPTGLPPIRTESYEVVPVDSIEPHPRNVNEGDVGAIATSLDALGFYGACLVQRSTRKILAGKHRWLAARDSGMTEVPVLWLDVDDDEAVRVMLSDNRTARLGHDDDAALARLLGELNATPLGLRGTGFDGDDLDALIRGLAITDWSEDEERHRDRRVEDSISVAGDLWDLNGNRLLCGDATNPDDHARLTDGTQIDLLYLDPPYGMNLDVDGARGRGASIYDPVAGDDAPFDPSPVLGIYESVREQVWWGADYYRALIPDGGSWLVWDKRSDEEVGDLDNRWGNHFELAWSRKAHRRVLIRERWNGIQGIHDPGEVGRRIHPTQKPVALHLKAFDVVGAGPTVLDCYAGSGSTLIACVASARQAYLMEMAPAYVDAICRRFYDHTGIVPTRVGDGAPFPVGEEPAEDAVG